MEKVELIATSAAGIEAVVKKEVTDLGFDDARVDNGRIIFSSDVSGIPRSNLWLRSADRVLLKMGEFEALSFEDLFEGTRALPWGDWIAKNGKFTVTGKSVKSKLFSVPDCQAIVKKAVVEKLKSKYKVEWFEENGPEYTIQVALLNDTATLTIDTSGIALHRRGYRALHLEAPIKETLASAMIKISYWNKNKTLLDPFCGSGTIPIEAALIGKNIAPGLGRTFASQHWPAIEQKLWKLEKENALQSIDHSIKLRIRGSDIDPEAIKLAGENAVKAGVGDCIDFSVSDFHDLKVDEEYGVLFCNPPYGERIGKSEETEKMYKDMGRVFGKLSTWSKYIITPEENFEKLFGKKADKKRKLYNGRIKVDYYQYFGPPPPRTNRQGGDSSPERDKNV